MISETLTLMRDRISKSQCPICGIIIIKDEFNVIIDEYITAEDAIKICKNHQTLNTDSKQL